MKTKQETTDTFDKVLFSLNKKKPLYCKVQCFLLFCGNDMMYEMLPHESLLL